MVICMINIIKYLNIFLILLFIFNISVKAESKDIYVNLEKLEYSTNKKDYSNITIYKTLKEFLNDYNSNNLPDIYITEFLFDGV